MRTEKTQAIEPTTKNNIDYQLQEIAELNNRAAVAHSDHELTNSRREQHSDVQPEVPKQRSGAKAKNQTGMSPREITRDRGDLAATGPKKP
jgi:hypothetical protein